MLRLVKDSDVPPPPPPVEEYRYVSSTERSAMIRAALKAKGITSRQVSVKTDQYSMGSTIRIRIKVLSVKKPDVEAIAMQHEDVRYCHASGEILSGGNRFVQVDYDHDAVRDAAAPVERYLEDATRDGGEGTLDHGFIVYRDKQSGRFYLAQFDETAPYPRCAIDSWPCWDLTTAARTYIEKLASKGLF